MNLLDAISSGGVSTGPGFRSVAKPVLRVAKGSIWWGQFRGFGWKNG